MHGEADAAWKMRLATHGMRPHNSGVLQTDATMADLANSYPQNVPGKFYVDNQCIDCDLCRETAQNHFKRWEEGGYSYVFNQPTTPEEEAACMEALSGCPVEAIGKDGTVAAA